VLEEVKEINVVGVVNGEGRNRIGKVVEKEMDKINKSGKGSKEEVRGLGNELSKGKREYGSV
ncbi:hypothetical protein, partial [Staphylococcus warneri]|uniref:hypothetical protein n=1 Tax=Staphylococcus warneri TaxID=1292 RepID=UPI001643AF18